MSTKRNNLVKYLAGGLIGGIVGVIAVYILEQNALFDEDNGKQSRKRLSKLGLSTISILWQLIGREKD